MEPNLRRLIIRLDQEYISTEFLPGLVRAHFLRSEPDYRVQVVDRQDRSHVIYSSEEGEAAGEGDASEDIFAMRSLEFRSLIPAFQTSSSGIPAVVSSTRANRFDVRVFRGVAGEHVGNFGFATDAGEWRVTATHRAGSLDAAVQQVRRRNLAVSFGILGLLSASMGIILVSASRAQRLARQQMEFVSTVSHELRTPLAVICSAGENLADGVVREPEQLKSYGKVVRNEGRRLAELVEQVLSFSGIQSGLKRHTLVATDVTEIVNLALDALETPIRESGFSLDLRIPESSLPVMADPPALARALQNLIGNGMKYSGESRWLRISAYRAGNIVGVSVQDKGIGIAASDLPHIFEPFYRGRSAIDAQVQGSGLGLSLVHEIVRAHGGRIEVNSVVGAGSTFTVSLPAG
jgi:signal transduction histidine kinase